MAGSAPGHSGQCQADHTNMLERAVILGIVAVVLMGALASVLPRITPSLIALGVLAFIGRVVRWYTR